MGGCDNGSGMTKNRRFSTTMPFTISYMYETPFFCFVYSLYTIIIIDMILPDYSIGFILHDSGRTGLSN